METDKSNIEQEIREIEEEIEKTRSYHEIMQQDVEEATTQRQMNFELLLQLQKKLNIYTDVSKGRKPHLVYKTESSLMTEYNKEIELNSKLSKMVENLQEDFPNHSHELNRIFNTLKLPVYVYYQ
ncbi:hypothetical protein BDFB_004298 [Asbolus verrucosus]|uniref:Uncharacterized protein n=1 Tax=Asbolus verrucosus TaxID=1661398 RepID=A0A482VQM8_ASBVE|nr:hypothetical protein BDFB_004298 [Asbolus verrucosus]